MDLKLRLLGFVFASADLVFEITAQGSVIFALGAVEKLTGHTPETFIRTVWEDIFIADDRDLLTAVIGGLAPGERSRALQVGLRPFPNGPPARSALLSVFRLPQKSGRFSCALSLGAISLLDETPRREGGFLDFDAFEMACESLLLEAEGAGVSVRLDLVEMSGLDAAVAEMGADSAKQVRRRVAATFRAESYAGLGASEVSPERFALIRAAGASSDKLSARLREASTADIAVRTVELPLDGQTTGQNLRAMRYALNRFIEEGPTAAASSFRAMVDRTVVDVARFKSILAAGAFRLVYQPVVDFAQNQLHHFEALARFDGDVSPTDTIRLAEELELICDFDLAVFKIVANILVASETRIAVNISAVSLLRPGFPEALIAVTSSNPAVRARLLLELTETQVLGDLRQANEILRALRSSGHLVCLDDFGAGAASLDYVRHLDVDFVKIDGRYVQSANSRPRDVMILRHVVALCGDLGVKTIAEMVETEEAASIAMGLGVTLGQGWFFGKPTPEPIWSPAMAEPPREQRKKVGSGGKIFEPPKSWWKS